MVSEISSGHEYMIEMAIFSVQRVLILKVGKYELRCMGSAHCFIVLYIDAKFRENISKVSQFWKRHEIMKR